MATPTYVPLATITLGSTDSEIVFSSIPASYRDLIVVVNCQPSGSVVQAGLRFNSDTGANYTSVVMAGNATPPFSGSQTSSVIPITQAFAFGAGDGNYAQSQIMDYSATDKHKTVLTRSGVDDQVPLAAASRWANTVAIHTVSVVAFIGGQSFAAGSTFSLFGVA